jgi:enediyne biosynthesis protein E3
LTVLCRARRAALGISPDEVRAERRGFRCYDPRTTEHLERIGTEFLKGYHAALEESSSAALAPRLNLAAAEYRGFAYEGAAMALALADRLHIARRSFDRFLEGPGATHLYMLHVGAGWAIARLPWLRRNPLAAIQRFDPLLRWLALDGFGFHEGYFHWPRVSPEWPGYAQRAYDQGLGRSLWFVDGMDPDRIARTIVSFEAERRADLWAGAGLACTYAGGADFEACCALRDAAGADWTALAQGAAFAAEARRRAGNPTADSDTGCRALCGLPAAGAAAIAREEMSGLPADGAAPAYEVWRGRIRGRMAAVAAGARALSRGTA